MATLDTDQLADLRMDIGSTNNVQIVKLSGSPGGGSFTLTLDGTASGAIAYNASAATLQTALEAVSTIGTGNVTVTGAAGGPWKVVLVGDGVELMTAVSSLTGGTSPTVTVSAPLHFSDAALNRFYTRAGGSASYEDATRVYALRALLARFARAHTYLTGLTEEDRQEVFNNLEKLLTRWEKIAGMSGGRIVTRTLYYGLDQPDPDEA